MSDVVPLKILELFCGTKSFSKEAEKRGHKVVTLDINEKFKPDIQIDILNVDENMNPYCYTLIFDKYDVVWASCPCTEYSKAKSRGIRRINEANKIVIKTLEIIKQINPKFWIIENPQTGKLKEQGFMKDLPYIDVSYCKYGVPYRKQTRLWNNIGLKLKTCNKDCDFMNGNKHLHNIANARKQWTNKSYNLLEKYAIPKELCLEIIKQIEVKL